MELQKQKNKARIGQAIKLTQSWPKSICPRTTYVPSGGQHWFQCPLDEWSQLGAEDNVEGRW